MILKEALKEDVDLHHLKRKVEFHDGHATAHENEAANLRGRGLHGQATVAHRAAQKYHEQAAHFYHQAHEGGHPVVGKRHEKTAAKVAADNFLSIAFKR